MSLLSSYSLVSLCSKCNSKLSRLILPHQLQPYRHYQWKQQTHYDVLGVHPEASQAEIKEAYLKLSKVGYKDFKIHYNSIISIILSFSRNYIQTKTWEQISLTENWYTSNMWRFLTWIWDLSFTYNFFRLMKPTVFLAKRRRGNCMTLKWESNQIPTSGKLLVMMEDQPSSEIWTCHSRREPRLTGLNLR